MMVDGLAYACFEYRRNLAGPLETGEWSVMELTLFATSSHTRTFYGPGRFLFASRALPPKVVREYLLTLVILVFTL